MNLDKTTVSGSPHIGVFIFANNKVALVPPRLSRSTKRTIKETLEVDVIETTIAGTRIIGVLVAGNDRCLLLPRISSEDEIDHLKESLGRSIAIRVVKSKCTALGNLIVANNKAAIVSSEIEREVVREIESTLGVKAYVGAYAGTPAVGAIMVVNDSVGLVHPSLSDSEIAEIERRLGVKAGPATVNEGVEFIKSGAVINNKGVLLGSLTTGPEIMNIQAILG